MNRKITTTILGAISCYLMACYANAQETEYDIDFDRMDGGSTSLVSTTADIGTINVENISRYPDLNISNALQGQAAGLIVRANDGGLGNNGSDIYVRGLHTSGARAIVVIDGIERPMDDITAEEIDSIEILKDAPAKMLYGPRAANGVLVITTKRGKIGKRTIRATTEYGVSPSVRMPEFLGSPDYVNLYNEARANDGLPAYYLPYQIEGYQNSKGPNDLLYPDVDWYGTFTKKMDTYRKAILELNGGTRYVRYALVAGYTGGSGLENVGRRSDLDRLNVRGNLDIVVTDFLTVSADVSARLEIKKWGGIDGGGLFSEISTLRPNEYPLTIKAEDIGMPVNEDGSPYYGTSTRKRNNLLVDMMYGGNTAERYVNSQTNFGIKLDLDRYVKGLFGNAYVTFDNYNYVREKLSKKLDTYAVDGYLDESGEMQMRIAQMQKIDQNDDIVIASEITTRQIGWRANVGYGRLFGKHKLSAVSAFRYYKDEKRGAVQDCVTANFTTRLNYSWDSRYYAEVILGLMSSNQLARGHRTLFTPAVSAGWILSDERFLKNTSAVDLLKVKASFGRIGFYNNGNYLLYRTSWNDNGSYATGATNNGSIHITTLNTLANNDLNWVTSSEFSMGIESVYLGTRLKADFSWFHETRRGTITKATSQYSDIAGVYIPSVNYGSVRNTGLEVAVGWNDSISDFHYSLQANMTFSRNKILKTDELSGIEDYRKSVGKPTSTIFGLQAEGLFGKDVPLSGHPRQMFGYYMDGDIAYRDLNGDGIVDNTDQKGLGQTFPVTVWGINAELSYKGIGLYVLGTAETGASVLQNNAYYWNRGLDAYSVKALDRYHPVNSPDGNMPRLTTTSGDNSYRSSSFWVKDCSFFRLKNVELSYTFDKFKASSALKSIKVFLRGTNLAVVSGIKDLDPERIDAGVTGYPVFSTYTGGVSVTF